MSAFTAVREKIETSNRTDDDLIFMGLISEKLKTTEGGIVTAAIIEILCDRHPEISDKVDDYMDDFESPFTFIEFLSGAIAN